jgi:hypothetical protein
MMDNPLIALLITTINAGLAAQSVTVGIQQAYQPTQQGVPTEPYLLISKIADARYGFTQCTDAFDNETGVMTHSESEQILTTFQIGVSAIQNPADVSALTQADYIKAAATALQLQSAVSSLNAAGVGIERIMKIRQTFFKDEKGRFEASPIFEFTVSHFNTVSYEIGSTSEAIGTVAAF